MADGKHRKTAVPTLPPAREITIHLAFLPGTFQPPERLESHEYAVLLSEMWDREILHQQHLLGNKARSVDPCLFPRPNMAGGWLREGERYSIGEVVNSQKQNLRESTGEPGS